MGAIVQCEVRGEVKIVGLSDGPIPWPIGKKGGAKSLVVYKDLAKALRNESCQAVGHWWGLSRAPISIWRKALGVGLTTPGTHALRAEYAQEPWAIEARRKALSKARDPLRLEKIGASKRGKPQPAHVRAALLKANLGRKASEEARKKMRAAHKARDTRPPWLNPPWTKAEDRLARNLSLTAAEVAKRTGRTLSAVNHAGGC